MRSAILFYMVFLLSLSAAMPLAEMPECAVSSESNVSIRGLILYRGTVTVGAPSFQKWEQRWPEHPIYVQECRLQKGCTRVCQYGLLVDGRIA